MFAKEQLGFDNWENYLQDYFNNRFELVLRICKKYPSLKDASKAEFTKIWSDALALVRHSNIQIREVDCLEEWADCWQIALDYHTLLSDRCIFEYEGGGTYGDYTNCQIHSTNQLTLLVNICDEAYDLCE